MTATRWPEVERLYHAALQRPAGERAAFLIDACAGDDDLRREVESLLAHERPAARFLAAPALDAIAKLMADEPCSFPAGRRFGPYTIHAQLGAGGMGEVYRARDSKLGRDVAIKTTAPLGTGSRSSFSRRGPNSPRHDRWDSRAPI